jgi:ATP-dependent exoDNAse (exonuclease V) alpha subunit
MADTRTLGALLNEAEERDARVVLIGDTAQLPAVGPGGLFGALVEREGAVRLEDNRRQQHEWERDALADLRRGVAAPALAAYAEHGRVHAGGSTAETRARLVEDWWDAAQRIGVGGAVMLAHRRADVAALNEAARHRAREAGHLTGPDVPVGKREYAVGDRVMCRKNNPTDGLVNGTRATITAIDDRTVRVRTDDDEPLVIPRKYAEKHLDHAYALTVHAAQGSTVEEAFLLAPEAAKTAELGYVALSRAREATHLYVTEGPPSRDLGALEPSHRGKGLDALADALSRAAAEPLAREQIAPKAVEIEMDIDFF